MLQEVLVRLSVGAGQLGGYFYFYNFIVFFFCNLDF